MSAPCELQHINGKAVEKFVEHQIRRYNRCVFTALMSAARKGYVNRNEIKELFTQIT